MPAHGSGAPVAPVAPVACRSRRAREEQRARDEREQETTADRVRVPGSYLARPKSRHRRFFGVAAGTATSPSAGAGSCTAFVAAPFVLAAVPLASTPFVGSGSGVSRVAVGLVSARQRTVSGDSGVVGFFDAVTGRVLTFIVLAFTVGGAGAGGGLGCAADAADRCRGRDCFGFGALGVRLRRRLLDDLATLVVGGVEHRAGLDLGLLRGGVA